MPTTGKVKSVRSRPPEIVVQPPGGPPTPEPIIFNVGIDATDITVASAAYSKGGDVEVTGTPPTCTGVKAT